MIQKIEARSTDRNVIVGSVGSSSKLTTFRTRSGMLENSSELKSYCGSSSESVCSFGTLFSFSSASLSVTLDTTGVFSFAGVAILLTNVEDLIIETRPKLLPLFESQFKWPRRSSPPRVILRSSPSNNWWQPSSSGNLFAYLSTNDPGIRTLPSHFLSGNMQ